MADTVSHEAIYTWLYALPKGELARQGILLRSGRTSRRPRRRATPGAGSWACAASTTGPPRSPTAGSPATGKAIVRRESRT